MRLVEFVVSNGEGTLLDHGYFELDGDGQFAEIFRDIPKGASVMFEEIDPDTVEFHTIN